MYKFTNYANAYSYEHGTNTVRVCGTRVCYLYVEHKMSSLNADFCACLRVITTVQRCRHIRLWRVIGDNCSRFVYYWYDEIVAVVCDADLAIFVVCAVYVTPTVADSDVTRADVSRDVGIRDVRRDVRVRGVVCRVVALRSHLLLFALLLPPFRASVFKPYLRRNTNLIIIVREW